MPDKPDIEKTTISVRTFVFCMWAVCGLGIGAAWTGAISWSGAQSHLRDHDSALEHILKNQDDQKATLAAAQAANQQLATQVLTISQQVATLQKRMDDYRPFKWSTPMQIEYTEQLRAKNPTVDPPDPQAIHDKVMPFTP